MRSSYGIETFLFLCSTLLVMLDTLAPELEREPGVIFYAVAAIVADPQYPQLEVRANVTLRYGRLVP
jgi:hypothetical protein